MVKLALKNTVVEWPAQRIDICVAERQLISCRGMLASLGDIKLRSYLFNVVRRFLRVCCVLFYLINLLLVTKVCEFVGLRKNALYTRYGPT